MSHLKIKRRHMSKQNSSSGGIGFAGLLTIVFIVLKLTGFINWSWWWVLAPIWIPASLVFAVLVGLGIAWLIFKVLKN